MQMETQVKFRSQQNISGAAQQKKNYDVVLIDRNI